MNDILPELLNAVEEAYQVNIEKDAVVKRLLNKLKSGAADYEKASDYAEHLGDALAKAFQAQIASDKLPDGKMYYNIAERLVNATFYDNYSRIASYCKETQESLNKAAGIGLKAQVPEFNQDRADGIIERLSEAEHYEDISWILGEPVTNFAMAIVDDHIKANADFQYKAGLSPKIVRTTNGKCCAWCDRLAGTYNYKDVKNTGNDVFRRHRHCRCKTVYDPADGKTVQNVWTKKEQEREIYKDQAKVDQRIEFSNGKPNYKHLPSDVIDEYQNQSNALYKEFARFEPDKLKALNEYTDSAYIGINEYLATKKGNLKQYAQYVNSIEGAMEQFHLKNDIIVYRGTQATFYEGIKVGDTFDSKIFYSTSYSEDVAKDFSNVKKEPLLLEIHAPKNSKCIFIGQNSTSFDEGEFIFSHKSRYKVIDQQDGKMVLEVINEKD